MQIVWLTAQMSAVTSVQLGWMEFQFVAFKATSIYIYMVSFVDRSEFLERDVIVGYLYYIFQYVKVNM